MSRERRREMVDRQHPTLSTLRQCALLGISRSSLYYRPKGTSCEDLALMNLIDQQYLATPFYGSRRMRVWLSRQGHQVSRKRVQRLMRTVHPPKIRCIIEGHYLLRFRHMPSRLMRNPLVGVRSLWCLRVAFISVGHK